MFIWAFYTWSLLIFIVIKSFTLDTNFIIGYPMSSSREDFLTAEDGGHMKNRYADAETDS